MPLCSMLLRNWTGFRVTWLSRHSLERRQIYGEHNIWISGLSPQGSCLPGCLAGGSLWPPPPAFCIPDTRAPTSFDRCPDPTALVSRFHQLWSAISIWTSYLQTFCAKGVLAGQHLVRLIQLGEKTDSQLFFSNS